MASLHGERKLLAALRGSEKQLLPFLGTVTQDFAGRVRNVAQTDVPRDDGTLASSSFVDGPRVDKRAVSVGSTTGYTAPHAPFAHEGVHYGYHSSHPSKWLERAANAVGDAQFTQGVRDAIWAGLKQLTKKGTP